jgi:hypothetical protein
MVGVEGALLPFWQKIAFRGGRIAKIESHTEMPEEWPDGAVDRLNELDILARRGKSAPTIEWQIAIVR